LKTFVLKVHRDQVSIQVILPLKALQAFVIFNFFIIII